MALHRTLHLRFSFSKDVLWELDFYYFLRKHYAKSFKGILKKSHFSWLFQTTICGYFVYFVSIKICIIAVASGTEAMAVP